MKITLFILLACSSAWAQAPAGTSRASAMPAPTVASAALPASDPQTISDLVQQMRTAVDKSDADMARLRIEKWKLDAANKQQAISTSDSIRRNLAYSMPDLLQRIQASPASLNANFRLYRNLDTLCDAFGAFVESAEAFGPRDQSDPLAVDVAQLDHLRRQLGDRMDTLAGANDAELARLRAQIAGSGGTKATSNKVVVNDDEQPKTKRKAKPATSQTQSQPSK